MFTYFLRLNSCFLIKSELITKSVVLLSNNASTITYFKRSPFMLSLDEFSLSIILLSKANLLQ